MTDSNQTQLAYVEEVTIGTTPGSPSMRLIRFTGESLAHNITNVQSNEIRTDRMVTDLVQVGAVNAGSINWELSFPLTRTFFSDFLESALYNAWTLAPEKFNVTADSSITDAGTVANTYAVDAGGTAFVLGHLVRASAFTNGANNQLFKVASSTATTVVGSALSLTAETAPPAKARLKVVGFEGASGDLTAETASLDSTTLDLTTLGLQVGQWLKIGGTAAGEQFATAADNDWVRISGTITANSIPLDNLPSFWAADTGSAKTIRVWFGDVLKNGTTRKSFTIEKGFLEQSATSYIDHRGMVVGGMNLNVSANEIMTGNFSFLGMSASVDETALDGTPTAASTEEVLNAVANVGRISEAGAEVVGPNYVQSVSLAVNNNLREKSAIGTLGLIDVGAGTFEITGTLNAFFGNKTLYEKYLGGTASNVNWRVAKGTKAVVMTVPNLKFETGTVVASGANQDVVSELGFRAILDSTTTAMFQIDRVEEFAV